MAPTELAAAAKRAGFSDVHVAESFAAALKRIAAASQGRARVLICGSLYLAGEVLRENR